MKGGKAGKENHGDVAWRPVGGKASGSFADELLSFKYRDSETSFFPWYGLVYSSVTLPGAARYLFQQVAQ